MRARFVAITRAGCATIGPDGDVIVIANLDALHRFDRAYCVANVSSTDAFFEEVASGDEHDANGLFCGWLAVCRCRCSGKCSIHDILPFSGPACRLKFQPALLELGGASFSRGSVFFVWMGVSLH